MFQDTVRTAIEKIEKRGRESIVGDHLELHCRGKLCLSFSSEILDFKESPEKDAFALKVSEAEGSVLWIVFSRKDLDCGRSYIIDGKEQPFRSFRDDESLYIELIPKD